MFKMPGDEHSFVKPKKVRKHRCSKGDRSINLRKRMMTNNIMKKGIESYHEFVGHRHTFIETLRDEIQNSSHFDEDMIEKVEMVLTEITAFSGDYSEVVDTDEYDSSSSSSSNSSADSDSGRGSQHENTAKAMKIRQVNFAYHVERIMKAKFLLLDDKMACVQAAKLAIAVKMPDKYIFEMKLDNMVSAYRMRRIV